MLPLAKVKRVVRVRLLVLRMGPKKVSIFVPAAKKSSQEEEGKGLSLFFFYRRGRAQLLYRIKRKGKRGA